MTSCRALLLIFAPLAFGCLLGIAIGNSLLVALEDAERERRERVTRVTEMEARYFCFDARERGPVIESVVGGVRSLN